MNIPERGGLVEPHLTHQMMYSDPAFEMADASRYLVRGVVLGVEEHDSDTPAVSAHFVRGLYYDQHLAELTNAYAESMGLGAVDEDNADIFGGMEVDGVARTPLLFTTEFPGSSAAERKFRIQLWLGSATDPQHKDMDRLVVVRNSLVHIAAVGLQEALEIDLEGANIDCIVDVVSADVWREQLNVTAHGYTALREQLADAPAPDVMLQRRSFK